MNLTDIYRTFHPKEVEYTLFSSAHRTLSRMEQVIDCETVLANLRLKWYQ